MEELVRKVAAALSALGIVLTERQITTVHEVWEQGNVYELRSGNEEIVFCSPEGKPTVNVHNNPQLTAYLNSLIVVTSA